jgi:hypothetical protein
MKPAARIFSKRAVLAASLALATCASLMPLSAAAGGGDFAAGLLGGLAVGTLAGAAAAQPSYYYPYPAYYYPPPPVYVPAPRCWFEYRRVWDGYGYPLARVRVCG